MSQLGIGVIIDRIGGVKNVKIDDLDGVKITCAEAEGDELRLEFENGRKLRIWDNGQSCCESRYMSTDDDPNWLVGKKFKTIEAKEANDIDAGGEVHERVFIEVMTYDGPITLVNHNEHNGYYGGFSLRIEEIK